jgi:hypothetical protein
MSDEKAQPRIVDGIGRCVLACPCWRSCDSACACRPMPGICEPWVRAQLAEAARLRAEREHITPGGDGEPLWPGKQVWTRLGDGGWLVWRVESLFCNEVWLSGSGGCISHRPHEVRSTREASEKGGAT